jgi:cytochrome b561
MLLLSMLCVSVLTTLVLYMYYSFVYTVLLSAAVHTQAAEHDFIGQYGQHSKVTLHQSCLSSVLSHALTAGRHHTIRNVTTVTIACFVDSSSCHR